MSPRAVWQTPLPGPSRRSGPTTIPLDAAVGEHHLCMDRTTRRLGDEHSTPVTAGST